MNNSSKLIVLEIITIVSHIFSHKMSCNKGSGIANELSDTIKAAAWRASHKAQELAHRTQEAKAKGITEANYLAAKSANKAKELAHRSEEVALQASDKAIELSHKALYQDQLSLSNILKTTVHSVKNMMHNNPYQTVAIVCATVLWGYSCYSWGYHNGLVRLFCIQD